MSGESWEAVDRYLEEHLVAGDAALTQALEDSAAAGLPAINVAPNQGKVLHVLARAIGARRVLEIGTLGGYSTIWLARALPADGRLVTLELAPAHAEVARRNLERAGVGDRVEVRVGPASESLPALAAEGPDPFDLVFIDADKPSNAAYFGWAVRLARTGSLIVVDNVIRQGRLVEADSEDQAVQGSRAVIEAIAAEPRVTATALQTVGVKGHDGFAIALVTG